MRTVLPQDRIPSMSSDSNTRFATPFGDYALQRFPSVSDKSPLRAWDAADQYVLEYLAQQKLATTDSVILVNDQFGGLALPLHVWQPVSLNDSYLNEQGCRLNWRHNNLPETGLQQLHSLETPKAQADWIIIKVPKTLALLEDQLYRLRGTIHAGTRIVAAAMAKEIHNSTLALFEKVLGKTTTSLARKKARLIFCQPQPDQWQGQSAYPSEYTLPETGWTLRNHANVFSRAKLDIGTRFFMDHIDQLPRADRIVDLGCGNGLLGILAGQQQPGSDVCFVDESHMALASARDNAERILGTDNTLRFQLDNGLATSPEKSADLVLNNPPFHQKQVIGDHIAWQMFQDARRVLTAGGELWVIGNRHLQYHIKLKRLFGNCRTVAANKKFVLLAATKR